MRQSQGWQGAQTIPREVTWDAAASALLLNPVAEVALLRGSQLYAQDGVDLTGHNTSETVRCPGPPFAPPALPLTSSDAAP